MDEANGIVPGKRVLARQCAVMLIVAVPHSVIMRAGNL